MTFATLTQQPVHLQLEIAVMVLWAMGLGGLIGLERERASKALGIRTHMLVAGAAALVVAVSSQLVDRGTGDPSRGIHGVITGIGFLGAGAIIQSKKGFVTGLTSAASIFFTAGIGSAVAGGYGVTATVSTLLSLLVLYGIGYLSHRHAHPVKQPTGAGSKQADDKQADDKETGDKETGVQGAGDERPETSSTD